MSAEKIESRLEQIVMVLSRVAKTLGDDVSAERIMFTAEILEPDLNDEQIIASCKQVMKREMRFPPPVKFIDYGRGSTSANAEDALEKVMRAIRNWGDMGPEGARRDLGAAIWRIIQSFGGWYSLCTREDFNQGVFRAQFIQAFNTRVPHWEATGELGEMVAIEGGTNPMLELSKKLGDSNDLNSFIKAKSLQIVRKEDNESQH